jgi:murein DD-endopeptidase MepM/ murein hydrolase activator NlpD
MMSTAQPDPTPIPFAVPVPPTAPPCPRCGRPVDVRTPHVAIQGSAVRAYCSQACASTPALPMLDAPPPHRAWLRLLGHAVLGAPMLLFTSGPTPAPPAPPPIVRAAIAPAAPELPRFGPAWPPSESDWIAEIASDAWIHPLDGPVRRMPISDGRVFGAERPGDRPAECRSGHCGVDIGGEVWGEPIHAAHDGVVDRVQRGPNEEHGGLYVRLAHRDGTIFTQYFHLAAIPRRLEPGVHVKVGEVIGLLGDSGVKHSQPHLHFTVSVRPSRDLVEEYIDPEPLIALWPLRLSVAPNSMVAAVTAQAAPGRVRGAHKRKSHHERRSNDAPERHAAATDQQAD